MLLPTDLSYLLQIHLIVLILLDPALSCPWLLLPDCALDDQIPMLHFFVLEWLCQLVPLFETHVGCCPLHD